MSQDREWLPVPGFPGYERTRSGEYRSWRSNSGGVRKTPLAMKINFSTGYAVIYLTRDNKQHLVSVARGVLEDNVGPCPDGMECCHNNGNGLDYALSNLRWGTHVENEADKKLHGTALIGDRSPARARPECLARGDRHGSRTKAARLARGERHGNAVMTEEKVHRAVSLLDAGMSSASVGRELGVSESCIDGIRYGRNWTHVTGRSAAKKAS